jgi:cytochrome c oxidase cbb3-type subunit IV
MANLFGIMSSVITIVAFVTFTGIVMWAYSKRRREAFEQAANAPFALPEDAAIEHTAEQRA